MQHLTSTLHSGKSYTVTQMLCPMVMGSLRSDGERNKLKIKMMNATSVLCADGGSEPRNKIHHECTPWVTHPESPAILDLATQIQVHLSEQKAILVPWQALEYTIYYEKQWTLLIKSFANNKVFYLFIIYFIDYSANILKIGRHTYTHRCTGAIRGCYVWWAIEVAKVLVCRLAISRGEFIWENLGAHTIDGTGEVTVGYSCIPCLNAPHWLTDWRDHH